MSVGATLAKKIRTMPPVRIVVASFLLVIIVGGLLLMLPICSRSGQGTRAMDAFFTSVSAVCVTGLTRFDTWSHWSWVGQAVILFLVQIGGLGIITLSTGFALLFRSKLGLRGLSLAKEHLQEENLNVSKLIRMILLVTLVCEALGALILMLRFVPLYGAYGIWVSVFHAVSAYCNAGFDIMGFERPYESIIPYAGDPLVTFPLFFLVLIGGLGFVVLSDIYYAKIHRKIKGENPSPLSFHSVVVLVSELALLVLGAILFFSLEYDNTMKDMDFFTKLNVGLFQSNSVRTAGFTTIDVTQQTDLTKLISAIFSFIGSAPSSTGGGIKTTTLVVLLATVYSVMRGNEETVLYNRMIGQGIVYKALTIFTGGMVTVFVTAGVVLMSNPEISIGGVDALLEAVAAFSTSGMSANLTPLLDDVSLMALIVAMFIGRVGLVSLGLSVALRRARKASSVLPDGKLMVG